MIVVDSSVWIAHFRGHDTPAVDMLRDALSQGVVLTDLIYAELLVGVQDDIDAQRLIRELKPYPVISQKALEDHVHAAKLRRDARAAGTPVRGIVDCLIAAVCIRHGLPLLHDDRDFDRLAACSDLRIVAPAPPSSP